VPRRAAWSESLVKRTSDLCVIILYAITASAWKRATLTVIWSFVSFETWSFKFSMNDIPTLIDVLCKYASNDLILDCIFFSSSNKIFFCSILSVNRRRDDTSTRSDFFNTSNVFFSRLLLVD
jgi:hypothetical protein